MRAGCIGSNWVANECEGSALLPCGGLAREVKNDESTRITISACLVTADQRGRMTVGLADRCYLVHEEPDGTLIREPAVVITALERRFLENAALQASIDHARRHPEERVSRRPRP